MRKALGHWFGDGYHKLNQRQDARYGLEKLPTQDQHGHWLPDVRCIQAHFHHGHGFGLPYFYPEVDQYITILRDPFDLMVSMYFFTKGRSKAGLFWHRGRPVDITQQYPTIESYIRSYPYWMFSHLPQDLTLANYRSKLAEQFVYIGIFEDLQTSINRLAQKLGKPPVEVPRSNVSQYDEMVPRHLREQFYFDYPLPKKIYDFACEHYQHDAPTTIAPEIPVVDSVVNSIGCGVEQTLTEDDRNFRDAGQREGGCNLSDQIETAISPVPARPDEITDDVVVCGDMSPLEPS